MRYFYNIALLSTLALLLIASPLTQTAAPAGDPLLWCELPELPPLPGQTSQPGLAGAFTGVHNDALILAGGANFPAGLPWDTLADGSKPRKIYQRDIYVLQKKGDAYEWSLADTKLPNGFSYGVSIPTEKGLLCVGGEWREYDDDGNVKKFLSDKVFRLEHRGGGKIHIADNFPSLPTACSALNGAKVGDKIYIVGLVGGDKGTPQTNQLWSLDLSKANDKSAFVWKTHTPCPGPPRSHHITVASHDGRGKCLFLFSGRQHDPTRGWQFLTDAWKFDGTTWTRLADVGTNASGTPPVCVMAGTGIETGANHIAIFGGADGKLFREVEQELPKRIQQLRDAGQAAEANALAKQQFDLYKTHPGFSRDILVYHTITDTWRVAGQLPESNIAGLTVGSHVTATAVKWGDDILIPSGEVRPAVRSPKIWKATPGQPAQFGTLNFGILAGYLLALVAMGVYFSRREKTTEDFFKASGRIPWWAAGLSIFGTQLSAITFMAIPANSFATDWKRAIMNLTIIAVAPFIIFLFLPFYRRLNVTTAYEYIEKRFNLTIRLIASAMFIVFQFARIGIVLFLPSIALSIVTGIDIQTCILVMGILSILYTVLGGIEAVIWTDVIQVFVLMGGAIFVLLYIPNHVPDGSAGIINIANNADKLRLFDFHFSLQSPTLWVLILGGVASNLISYGGDQAVIQRYLTTKDEKSAARGIWLNGFLTIPATLIFFALGTALFAFFKTYPDTLNPTIQKGDAIFPWFIVTQLPNGVAGLLIAGVFAAAMSSLDSSMNSVATAFTTDFYRRFKPNSPDHRCLRIARVTTVLIGLLGMGIALVMATWEIQSLWDEFSKYIGLFGGGLGGLFVLAIFTKRATAQGALVGLIASAIVQFLLKQNDVVHGLLFSATGMLSCLSIGYLASLVLPAGKKKELNGLTIYTLSSLPTQNTETN